MCSATLATLSGQPIAATPMAALQICPCAATTQVSMPCSMHAGCIFASTEIVSMVSITFNIDSNIKLAGLLAHVTTSLQSQTWPQSQQVCPGMQGGVLCTKSFLLWPSIHALLTQQSLNNML